MSDYGLAGLRDKDGDLQAVDYSYEWNDDEITIKLRPPTIAEQEELEDLDDDAGPDELEEILERHIVKPEIKGSWTTREMWAYMEGIIKYSTGDEDGVADEIAAEIERRSDGQGN